VDITTDCLIIFGHTNTIFHFEVSVQYFMSLEIFSNSLSYKVFKVFNTLCICEYIISKVFKASPRRRLGVQAGKKNLGVRVAFPFLALPPSARRSAAAPAVSPARAKPQPTPAVRRALAEPLPPPGGHRLAVVAPAHADAAAWH